MPVYLVNTATGEFHGIGRSPVAQSQTKLRANMRGLRRIAEEDELPLHLLTLTLDDAHADICDNVHLNQFFGKLRYHVRPVHYVWVVALQEKRSEQEGRPVLHWHAIVGARSMPDHDDIAAWWGKGHVEIEPVRCPEACCKYLVGHHNEKRHDDLRTLYPKLRRFGASQMRHYRYADWGFDYVQEQLRGNPNVASCVIRKIGTVVGFYSADGIPVATTSSPWVMYRPDAPDGQDTTD